MATDSVWVAIRVEDGSRCTVEYRGRIDAAVFEKITTSELTSGWLRLDDVIWEKERLDVRQDDYGSFWGYGNTSFYRVESLSRIILLSDDFVRTHCRSDQSGKKSSTKSKRPSSRRG
jgi:hypothetical protein